VDTLSELYKRSVNRRKFLAGVGAAGAASMLAGCSSSSNMTTTTTSFSDTDILNFALNLEYLEAEFYLHAATGAGLSTADIGTSPGAVTGGTQVTGLTTAQQNIINEIAYDEQAHVRFLRSALGTAAVARPAIDITNSFNALASAAGIASTFNPYASFDAFVVGAFIFEDVGVTAYAGAAPLISTAGIASGYLAAAAGIMAVEAYHAAYARTYLTAQNIANSGYPYLGYANKVSALRATLGGSNETTLTVPTGTVPVTATTIVAPSSIVAATSANAIAYARNTDQVLHIVYGTAGGAGVKSGGFFPSGLNGKISVTQS
jgi:Ferritin-like domain